jgi:hypothetical protein
MLSFFVVNLLPPGDPETLELATPSGTWTLERFADYEKSKAAIANGQCAHTYILEHPAPAAFDELTPILLGASYATGLTVTIRRSTMGSEMQIMQPSQHWPRDRAMESASPIVNSPAEFIDLGERFVKAWAGVGQTEKALLLVHHWLDALACWSMEDLYLSATTLLQVIVATEADRQRRHLNYYPGVTAAARSMNIPPLSNDFKDMRNVLIHEGRLIGGRFRGHDKAACAMVVAEVLNWFDAYMHVALSLGAPRRTRFRQADFMGLNAFSI